MDRASALPGPAKRAVPLDYRTIHLRPNAQMCKSCYRELDDPYWHEQTPKGVVCTRQYHCVKCYRRIDWPEYHRKSATGVTICLMKVWEPLGGVAWELKGHSAHTEQQGIEIAAIAPLIMRARGDSNVQYITFTATTDSFRGYPIISWETQMGQKKYSFTLHNYKSGVFLTADTFVKEHPGPYAGNVLCQYMTKVPLVLRPVIYLLRKIVPDMIDAAGVTVPALDPDLFYYDPIYEKISALAMHACAMMMSGPIPTCELNIGELKLHILEVNPIRSHTLKCDSYMTDLLMYLHEKFVAEENPVSV